MNADEKSTSSSVVMLGGTQKYRSNQVLIPSSLFIFLLTATTSTLLTAVVANGGGTQLQVGRALELQCPPCERVHCSPRRASQLRCRGGVVRGVCNCCPVCAKLVGEPCGGQWHYLGRCDAGLYCDDSPSNRLLVQSPAAGVDDPRKLDLVDEVKVGRRADKLTRMNNVWKSEGHCRLGHELSDSPQPMFVCFPPCTAEFCRKNSKALCSAVANAERKRSCQGDCQHTSCSACRFVSNTELDCSTSIRCQSPSDTECLRRFGRCIRRQQCRRAGFPCKLDNKEEDSLKFLCIVPECSSSSRP